MATIHLTPQTVLVRFTTGERFGGLVRDIDVPRSSVVSARVEPDGVSAVSGLRAPGLALPGRRKIGTWRGLGDHPRRTAVSVSAGQAAVRLVLRDHKWDQLLIGADDAEDVVARLAG